MKTVHIRNSAVGLLHAAFVVALAMIVSLSIVGDVAAAEADFPRALVVEGERVTIPHKPMRIAAVSGDVADIVLELVDVERVVVLPLHQENPVMYRNHAKAELVEGRIAGATQLDPEAVLAYDPDLIVLTLTHGAETDALNLLALSGIPIISVRDWSGFAALKENVRTIGRAVGEDEAAAAIVDRIDDRLAFIAERIADVERPWGLPLSVVSPQSNKPYLLGPTSFKYDLMEKAGAKYAGERLGVSRTIVASMEQLIQADPEYLLLSDWSGKGIEAYEEFLGHPGMMAVTAVAEGNVLVLPYRELWHTLDAVDGIEKVAAWLYPELF